MHFSRRLFTTSLFAATLAASAIAIAGSALAHHGWSWTDKGDFRLSGTITEIYIGNPHATLDVNVNGDIWRVELAPPSRTIRAGFTEDVAKVGDDVIAIGERSADPQEKRMKAVRITIAGTNYDVYPDRIN